MSLKDSELILTPEGSIYHLNLKPENLAETVITVGDPDRVEKVTKHFDEIEFTVRKREFCTQTGSYKGKRITVISTGIGTDNIDIVLNELDALVNIDFEKRIVKKELKSLDIIRIGTTGSIQEAVPVDSFLISEKAIGFDGLLHFYQSAEFLDDDFSEEFIRQTDWFSKKASPYIIGNSEKLQKKFASELTFKGITATNIGFYGPQGRSLRLALQDDKLNQKLATFDYHGQKITNLEMETSGIYGLAKLLGHHAISMNTVIANRATGEFSKDPVLATDRLIKYCLEKLVA